MQIVFTEWLYDREILTVDAPMLPRRDEQIACNNQTYKVILVTHCFNMQYKNELRNYFAKVEVQLEPL